MRVYVFFFSQGFSATMGHLPESVMGLRENAQRSIMLELEVVSLLNTGLAAEAACNRTFSIAGDEIINSFLLKVKPSSDF